MKWYAVDRMCVEKRYAVDNKVTPMYIQVKLSQNTLVAAHRAAEIVIVEVFAKNY